MAPARRPPSASSSSSSTASSQPPPPPAPYSTPSFSRPFSRYPSFKQNEAAAAIAAAAAAAASTTDHAEHAARGPTPDRESSSSQTPASGLPPPPPPPSHQHSAAIPPPQRYHHPMPPAQTGRQHANLIMRRPASNAASNGGYTIGVPMSFSRGAIDQQEHEDSDEIPGDDDEDDDNDGANGQEAHKQHHSGAPQSYQHQPSQLHQQSAYAAQQSFSGMPPSTQPPRQSSYPHSYPQHQGSTVPPNGKHRKTSTSISSTGSQTGVSVTVNNPPGMAMGSAASPGAAEGGATSPQQQAGGGSKSASPGKTTKKRDRISQACNFCRQRRMKCRGGRPPGGTHPNDPGQPCDRCAEKGSDCSWSCYSESGRQATTARKKSRLSGAPLPESLTTPGAVGPRQSYDGVGPSGSNSGNSSPKQSQRHRGGGQMSPAGPTSRGGNRSSGRKRALDAAASAREESGYGPETQSQDSQALAVHAALQYQLQHRGDIEDSRPQPLTLEVGAPSGAGRESLQPRAIVPDGVYDLKRKRSDHEASAALMMMPHIDPALGGGASDNKRSRRFDPNNTYSNGAVAVSFGPARPSAIYSRGAISSRKALRATKGSSDGYSTELEEAGKNKKRRRNTISGGVNLSDPTVLNLAEEHKARSRASAPAGANAFQPVSQSGKSLSFERDGPSPDTPMSAPAAAEDYLGATLLPVSPILRKQVADITPRGTSQRRRDLLSGSNVDLLDLHSPATPHDAFGHAGFAVGAGEGAGEGGQQYQDHIDPSLGPSASQINLMPPLSQSSFKPSSDSQLEPWFDIGGAGMPSQQSQQVASQHYSHHPYHHSSAAQAYGYSGASQTPGWPYATTAPSPSPQQQHQQPRNGSSVSAYGPYAQQLPYSHYRYTPGHVPGGSPGSYAANSTTAHDGSNYYPLPSHGEGSLSQLADMSLARFGDLAQSHENGVRDDDEVEEGQGQRRRSDSLTPLNDAAVSGAGAETASESIEEPPTADPHDPLIEYGQSQAEANRAAAAEALALAASINGAPPNDRGK